MPAPKRPNTAAATAAVVRRGQETMVARLRAAGWTCTPPDDARKPGSGTGRAVRMVHDAWECADAPSCSVHGLRIAQTTRYGPSGHPIDPAVCKNALGGPCGPQDCVLDHARPVLDGEQRVGAWRGGALMALRSVLAEVDAHEVATGRGGMPYAETVETLRRVATEMGVEL